MKFERGFVVAGNQIISTVSGRRFENTPENVEALLQDNNLLQGAKASRPPEQSRTTTWRISAEAADRNPTGPDPWQGAISIHRAMIASNGFRDTKRTAELEAMEAESRAFQERREKLLTLRPEPEAPPDPMRSAAESLKKNSGNLGDKLASKVAERLTEAADESDLAREAAAKETARTTDRGYVLALELQRGEVFILERSVCPPEMLANAKKLLANLEGGSISADEYWGVYEKEQSKAKYAFIDSLEASKKAEIAKARAELKVIGDLTPPVNDPPKAPDLYEESQRRMDEQRKPPAEEAQP